MIQWTDNQLKAINDRGHNLLVSAAAGSGKTAVLVERIIQLIMRDKIDIDRLLIVTFTHAAAGEMRERISAAIMAELQKENLNQEQLLKQLNLLSHASISTLHAFCMEVVRKYFFLLDVDPDFRIGDTVETEIMKQEVLEELFEAEYEKACEYFLNLVEMFGSSKDDGPLQTLVLHCYSFIQSQPYPLKWLEEKVRDFKLDKEEFEKSPWIRVLGQQLSMQVAGARDLFLEAGKLTELPGGPLQYRDAIIDDLEMTEGLLASLEEGLYAFYSRLQGIRHKRLPRVSPECDEELKEKAKAIRDEGKRIIKDIQKSLDKSPEECRQDLHKLYPCMKYFCELLAAFDSAYREKKMEKGMLDFNDLEHYALEILAEDEAAQDYRQRFEYIFFDEYQDSNLVQEKILNSIRRDNNLFLVGDVKQSIYRFRLADPSIFMEKYHSYQKENGATRRRIDLSSNFRSRPNIIHAVNYIFANIMSKELGEIDYDENASLYPGVPEPPAVHGNTSGSASKAGQSAGPAGTEVELLLLEKDADSSFSDEEGEETDQEIDNEVEEMDDIELEARLLSRRIKGLLGQQIFDAELESFRGIDYRDIVVLLRATRNTASVFLDTFLREGIPAYADINSGYFEAIEVNIFLNLLRLIDNKRQDIPLLSVMRSPICGFSVEELIEIRLKSQAESYFEAVEEYMDKNQNDLQQRLQAFVEKINSWKLEAGFFSIDDFIWKLLMETGYYYYVGAMPGGIQRQANLRVLFDRARQFQGSSLKGLFNFLNFVERLNSSTGDMGTARILGENDNVVRIMSVHKSKGLEFPVVILAGMGKRFNKADTSARVLLHKELGIGPRFVDPQLRIHTDTLARMAIKNTIKLENLAEEMRILYVACTRAKEKLIMVASLKNIEGHARKWNRGINPLNLGKAMNYLDWIGPVLMIHQDGERLRKLAGVSEFEEKIQNDSSKWKIDILKRADISMENILKQEAEEELRRKLESPQKIAVSSEHELIEGRLNWQYPYQDAVGIPSKLSVSQIKDYEHRGIAGIGVNIPALTAVPAFLQGKKELSAAARGTILHLFMQQLDMQRVYSLDELQGQVQEMLEKEVFTEEEVKTLPLHKILNFFNSGVGQRLLQAEKVFRELPFNAVQRAGDLLAGLGQSQEELLVQGVIDLCFQEGNELVLLDYKTDRIGPENREELIAQYRIQLNLYKNALEKIKGLKVKESYIYFFHTDEAVSV